MRPAMVSGVVTGDAPSSHWPIFFPVASKCPRSLCERYLGPVSSWYQKWRIDAYDSLACLNNRSKALARRVCSRPMDAHFGRNTRKIHLIFYNFMGKHAFWTASFNVWRKA